MLAYNLASVKPRHTVVQSTSLFDQHRNHLNQIDYVIVFHSINVCVCINGPKNNVGKHRQRHCRTNMDNAAIDRISHLIA